jgi:hypothetical protein
LAYSGIATHYVPKDKLEILKKDIIDKSNKDTNLQNIMEMVQSYAEITYTPENFNFPNFHEIQRTFLIDSIEEINNRLNIMLENGSDIEKLWAKKILNILNKVSQISLAVVLEQIKLGVNL